MLREYETIPFLLLGFQLKVRLLKDSIVKLAVKAGIEFIFLMNISTCHVQYMLNQIAHFPCSNQDQSDS